MKTNMTKLNRLIRNGFVDPDCYYCITVYEYGIVLQGHYTSRELVLLLRSRKFIGGMGGDGYITFKRSNIEITLTP